MIRDDELNRLIAESIHDEEESTLSLMKQLKLPRTATLRTADMEKQNQFDRSTTKRQREEKGMREEQH